MSASTNLLMDVERKRAEARLTQHAVARALGVSQAHYSKVVGRIVNLSPSLAERMQHWLASDSSEREIVVTENEIEALARSIRADARRLAQLVRNSANT